MDLAEAQANARLISAAPELLEICKDIIKIATKQPIGWSQLSPNIEHITIKIKQAVAKAEEGIK